jgi:RNA polymerase sigma factor (sigma-70 family)
VPSGTLHRVTVPNEPSNVSDEALMDRFCEGDAPAFEALFERYGSRVYAFLVRMVGDSELARDLCQATFYSLIKARGRYSRGRPVSAWIFAIAGNAAKDAIRRKKARPERVSADGKLPEPPAESSAVTDVGLERRLKNALAQLPSTQREAVLLHHVQGLSFAEVADSQGASVNAVKVRAHRGYEKLRALLRGLENES